MRRDVHREPNPHLERSSHHSHTSVWPSSCRSRDPSDRTGTVGPYCPTHAAYFTIARKETWERQRGDVTSRIGKV